MHKLFFLRLAWNNLRRDYRAVAPFVGVVALVSGVFLLIAGLAFSNGLRNMPNSGQAQAALALGTLVIFFFAWIFLIYINSYLIRRRKKEFGLYSVLGLSKRDVGHVLFWENLIQFGAGFVAGMLFTTVLGRLFFLVMLRLIQADPATRYSLSPVGWIATGVLFAAVFISTYGYDLAQIRLAQPMQLLRADQAGEKQGRWLAAKAVLGLTLLATVYTIALRVNSSMIALFAFFPLAFVVMIATGFIFSSGSARILGLLRHNRRLYLKPDYFVAISGLIHRLKQNAAGLSAICIVSCMLIVTVAGTIALYAGIEDMARQQTPFAVKLLLQSEAGAADVHALDARLAELAAAQGVGLSYAEKDLRREQRSKNARDASGGLLPLRLDTLYADSSVIRSAHGILIEDAFCFDVIGDQKQKNAFIASLLEPSADTARDLFPKPIAQLREMGVLNVSTRQIFLQELHGLFGGLLYLGLFFGLALLAVTVLLIYFKQMTEGYEDQDRFSLLRKVGMDDHQIRAAVSRQIRWVFLLPLVATLLHMIFASKMLVLILRLFGIQNLVLLIGCILAVCVIFGVLYMLVYWRTSAAYFRLVKRA